jgi:hypothetical protein
LKPYTFFEGFPGAELKRGFEISFFNEPGYCLSQTKKGWLHFHLLDQTTIVGTANFLIDGNLAKSPFAAPFGSFEFTSNIGPKTIYDFISQVISELNRTGVSTISIKTPTEHSNISVLVNVCLLNQGFHVVNAEIGALLRVDNISFEEKVDTWEQRKLKQAIAAGLITQQLPADRFDEVFTLIEASRATKKYPLSMERSSLEMMVSKFPGRYILHGVFQNERLIAASIGVVVKKDWFYNFYSDHDPDFDHLSPVVLLMKQLYSFCQSAGVTTLDLGTSAANNSPNFGLLDFKMRLGAAPVSKYTFEKGLV